MCHFKWLNFNHDASYDSLTNVEYTYMHTMPWVNEFKGVMGSKCKRTRTCLIFLQVLKSEGDNLAI